MFCYFVRFKYITFKSYDNSTTCTNQPVKPPNLEHVDRKNKINAHRGLYSYPVRINGILSSFVGQLVNIQFPCKTQIFELIIMLKPK